MAQPPFSSYVRSDHGSPTLAFEGAIDLATAPEAQSALQRFMAAHGPTVVLDMSRVNFIDSKGLGTLIVAAKAARDAGGQIYVDRPAIPVVKILELCGVTALFPPRPEGEAEAAPAAPPRERRAAAPRGGKGGRTA